MSTTIDWQAVESIALVLMGFFEAVTLYCLYRENKAKKLAEEKLIQIRRRGEAPFWTPCNRLFNDLFCDNGGGNFTAIRAGSPEMLCALREEVQLEDGREVVFVIENSGAATRAASIKLDGEEIFLRQEAKLRSAHELYYLVYPYHKAKHGQDQRMLLSYESAKGVQDTHIYLIKHGFRSLKRVNPALP
jgi:hypothetical protein